MSYQEFSPPPALAQHVRVIWQYQSTAGAEATEHPPIQRIVPDGHPELILHFRQPYAEVDLAGHAVVQVQALFAGQLTRALLLQQAPQAGVLGVRFRPASARAFFGLAMQALSDQRTTLSKFWGESAVNALLGELLTAVDAEARVAVVSAALTTRLAQTSTPTDVKIAQCAELLLTQQATSLDEMAARCACSRRQFERRFLIEVGVSPRLLASIARFRTLFNALEQDTLRVRHWAEAAQMAGYFDQAHMNREFKRFAGLSPQAFCQTLGGLSAAMVGAEVP